MRTNQKELLQTSKNDIWVFMDKIFKYIENKKQIKYWELDAVENNVVNKIKIPDFKKAVQVRLAALEFKFAMSKIIRIENKHELDAPDNTQTQLQLNNQLRKQYETEARLQYSRKYNMQNQIDQLRLLASINEELSTIFTVVKQINRGKEITEGDIFDIRTRRPVLIKILKEVKELRKAHTTKPEIATPEDSVVKKITHFLIKKPKL